VFILQTYLEPIYFYIYTVFALQTVYVFALFITSWLLSDSWLAGALSGVWYILNRYVCAQQDYNQSYVTSVLSKRGNEYCVNLTLGGKSLFREILKPKNYP